MSETLAPDVEIEAVKDIVCRQNQDGTVVLMKLDESDVFFKIDGIAAQVWNELSTHQSIKQINEKFAAKYPEHRANLEKDIRTFVGELLKRKLVIRFK